jgi:hypothetical protein
VPAKITGKLHINHVPGLDYNNFTVNGHCIDPDSIRMSKESAKSKGSICMYCGAKDPDTEEHCPKTQSSRHTLISYSDKEEQGQGYGEGPGRSGKEEAYEPDTLGWDGDKKQVKSTRHEGHGFAGDSSKVSHCPICGSGDVWGGSDGTIECNFCGTNFTVTVEPEFSGMPQTVGDQTYNLDGSINAPGSADDSGGAAPGEDDPGALEDDSAGSEGPPQAGGDEPDPGSPEDEEKGGNGSAFQASLKYYLTPTQDVLSEDAYMAHLASVYGL